ncbi:MAG: VOC family protein [Dehalococcoidia bacterium]
MPQPKRVGHLVLNVRDLDASTKFYTEVLGFEVARSYRENMMFLTCGKIHHDLALFQAAPDAAPVTPGALGLNHMALQVEDWEMLKAYYHRLNELGVKIDRTTDHGMTRSMYLKDPDGNGIELFCNSHENPADGLEAMQTQESLGWELVIS